MSSSSTIAALATAPFPAGLAVVRVSGPKARHALHAIFQGKKDPAKDPRRLIVGDLVDYTSRRVLGDALAVFFPAPRSYTGEDVCEFQFLGSPMLVQKALQSLYSAGIDPAEPGEFTRRAFLNGKLDLVQAEAIAQLAAATSEESLKLASEQLKGKLSGAVETIGEPLRDSLAELEAWIDFPDQDIEPADFKAIMEVVTDVRTKLEQLGQTFHYGQLVKDGFRILICGRPNVGKSSILNLLLNRPRAIVSDVSGTTRDLIEEDAILRGYRFVFCDSAGIRETHDPVEKIGVELARERIDWADVVLFVVDAAEPGEEWRQLLPDLQERSRKTWMLVNKIDLNPAAIGQIVCESHVCVRNFYLSARTRSGLSELTSALIEEVEASLPTRAEANMVVTTERQRSCLLRACEALKGAEQASQDNAPREIVSAEIRRALAALDEIVGKTWTEDILGRIFSKFCIGK